MSRLERVFGLSIDEEVQWGTALADLNDGMICGGIESGVLCDIPEGNKLPWSLEDKLFLEERVSDGLLALHHKRPEFFTEAVRIGISSIGVIDRQERLLVSVARKNWVTRKTEGIDRPFLVDFKSLFLHGGPSARLFPNIKKLGQITAQNDAPARCLTEYVNAYEANTQPDSLLYLMVGKGVNGAIVLSGDFLQCLDTPNLGIVDRNCTLTINSLIPITVDARRISAALRAFCRTLDFGSSGAGIICGSYIPTIALGISPHGTSRKWR